MTTTSIAEIRFKEVLELFATYAGSATDLAPWLQDAQINHDQNLRLQYLAGLGMNLYISDRIYDDMRVYRKFPDRLFAGSSTNDLATLRALLTLESLRASQPETKK